MTPFRKPPPRRSFRVQGRARDGLYEPGNPHELPPQISVQSVLGDPERQEGFREACEARGYQAYFHAVQDMVDFARCGEVFHSQRLPHPFAPFDPAPGVTLTPPCRAADVPGGASDASA